MKRILTIQDISCIGKCSLTVALPILSAAGIETAIVPTAVLSAHTQFSGVTFRDLTDDLPGILDHWKKEGFTFSAIYTGYLGSIRQIGLVRDYFAAFGGEGVCKIVDPAMADSGKLYTGFDDAFVKEMRSLCAEADVILPNISETAMMLGVPYPGEDASEAQLKELLDGLTGLGARISVITGASLEDGSFGYLGYDADRKEYLRYGTAKIPLRSHGTGDIFASTFTGALVNGFAPGDALKIASDYTGACIRNTYEDPEHVSYGVNFEAEIPYLLKLLGKI
jgi:pyridoxine kinase